MERDQALAMAQAVREALLREMEQAYQDAGLSGLCAEGRWELAVDRARNLDLEEALREKGVLAANERE